MFHSSHIHMPNRHRQRTALRTFFPSSSFSPPDSKEPLRRGILFSSVASVLLLVGCILTWLGFNDVFGGKISMTGPLLITLSLLMLLLSFRQFRLARKQSRTTNGPLPMEAVNGGGVTAVVVDQDDGTGAATVVMDTWDNAGANNEILRDNEELGPPAYMDVAQLSCSSNCPSFISHDDRNEAPPTYEETCGMFVYGSDTSLANTASRRVSSQVDGSPCTRHVQQMPVKGQASFESADDQRRRSSNTLCPSSALIIPPGHRLARSSVQNDTGDSTSPPGAMPQMSWTSAIVSADSSGYVRGPNIPQSSIDSDPGGVQSAQWSRRSFSSIPSYTCLLSESGEVSAQVYNTSSIIEGMMPGGSNAEEMSDLLACSSVPTRSHSTSSINNVRQGVPYDIQPKHSFSNSSNVSSPRASISQHVSNPEAITPEARRRSEGSGPGRNAGFAAVGPGVRQSSDSQVCCAPSLQPLPPVMLVQSATPSIPQGQGGNVTPLTPLVYSEGAHAWARGAGSRVPGQEPLSPQVKLLNTQDVQETI